MIVYLDNLNNIETDCGEHSYCLCPFFFICIAIEKFTLHLSRREKKCIYFFIIVLPSNGLY